MKKYLLFLAGFFAASPLIAMAYLYPEPPYDLNSEKSYYDAAYEAWAQGWMNADSRYKFRPKKYVKRSDLAETLVNYNRGVAQRYTELRDILCLNKANGLNTLGSQVVEKDRYAKALNSFCGTKWSMTESGCQHSFDANTGDYEPEASICP